MTPAGQDMSDELQRRIDTAFSSEQIPEVYFHAFVSSLMPMGDTLIILERYGKPIAKLFCSYSVAKTLALKLGELVKQAELKLGADIPTTDQLRELMGGGKDSGDGSDS